MSYILDALRRADSDRERGAVPSLHSNPLAAGPIDADDAESSAPAVQPLWWAVGGLSLALLAMLGWLVFGRAAPEPEPQRAADVAAAPAVIRPVTPAPVVPPPTATESPVVPPAVAPSVVPAAPAPVAPPVQEAPPPAPPARTAAAAKPSKPAAKADTAPAKTAPAVAENEAVPSISELPDDVRRQLPSLSVSGASYSKNAASRMLILNGQVFREGDKVANDVVLEQIRLKSAVFSFKGRRYSISF